MVFVSMRRRGEGANHRARPLSLLSAAALAVSLLAFSSPAFGADGDKSEESKESEDAAEAEEPESSNAEESKAGGSAALGGAAGTPTVRSEGPGDTIVFVEGGFRSDLGLLLQRDTIGRAQTETESDVKTGGPMLHIGFLTKVFWQFRAGLGLGYGFNFRVKERLTEFQQEQDEDPEVLILGQLFTADLRLEFSQPIIEDLELLVTPRGGIQAIDTGEAIREEIRQYRETHNTRTGLQLGALGGIDVGIRYSLSPWFSLRGTGGYAYYTQGILRAKRKGDAADSDHVWRMTGARVGLNVGAEVSF